ncbi:MAG: Gfo/Idh/MocA family oxidoreductase [Planctomycetota bacterium]
MISGRELRVAVVGVGHLGQHHARVFSELEGVRLAGVVDTDASHREAVALRLGCEAWARYEELPGRVDAASVAVPTKFHFEVASYLLEHGVPVLVEKPMTSTLEEGRSLKTLAESSGVLLQVGHIERFNPVFQAIRDFQIRPRFIEAHRLAPFSFRSTDVGVVMDLMIHDIDLVLEMVDSPVVKVDAVGGAPLSAQEDIANARLEFASGCIANITASRMSLKKLRRLRVFAEDSFISLDFDKKYGFVAKKAADFEAKMESLRGMDAATMGPMAAVAFQGLIDQRELELDTAEPLKQELLSFVAAVRDGREAVVPPSHGLRAMELACRIQDEIRKRGW